MMVDRGKPCSYVRRQTPCGEIRGLRQDGCLLFEGIKYANAGRWEDPQIVRSWEGLYDATRRGPACCQHAQFYEMQPAAFNDFYYNENAEKQVYEYSEQDGLNLNIWTPEDGDHLPVAVFIHGGSFVSGSNTAPNIFRGAEYCRRGVVLVNINYRLNAFATGYDVVHKGNYALKDQVAALTWVRENIAAFGGDPEQVTVMGESAGALSVQLLLYCPYAKGLFRGAVMMSGGGDFSQLGTPARPGISEAVWQMVMDQFDIQSLDELKDLPAKEVYEAWLSAGATESNLANNCAKPIVDGDWVPGQFPMLALQGEIADVPCIIGMSRDDMWPFYLYSFAVEWGGYHARTGRKPVYGYFLDRKLPGGDGEGAYHGCDLWYAFGTLDRNWRPFEEQDYRLSEDLIDYLTGFIKEGAPKAEGLARWEPLTDRDTKFLRFGEESPAMYQPPVARLAASDRNSLRPFPGM